MRLIGFLAVVAVGLAVAGQCEAGEQEHALPHSPVSVQQPPPPGYSSPWSFGLAPYLWFAALNGELGVRDLPAAQIDASFKDIFDNLDWWPPPIMLAGEVRYDRAAFVTDFIYLGEEVSGSTPGPLGRPVNADTDTLVWTFGGSYRVVQVPRGSIDLRAGARLWSMDTTFTLSGLRQVRQRSGSQTWVDPLIGVGGRAELGKGFAVWAQADVGGFGVGAEMDWQVIGLLQYQVRNWIALEAGYRYLAVNYDKNGFLFDGSLRGPIVGASFRF